MLGWPCLQVKLILLVWGVFFDKHLKCVWIKKGEQYLWKWE